MKLTTFLNFGGNCEQALRFYEQHLGGTIIMMMRRAEQPDQPVTWPGWESSIQYAIMMSTARS
jgi:PhnB protein